MRSRRPTHTAPTGQEFSAGDVVWRAFLLLIPLGVGAWVAWLLPTVEMFGFLLTVVLVTLLVDTALGGFRAMTAITCTAWIGFLLGWASRAPWDLRLQEEFLPIVFSGIGPVMVGCYLTLVLGLILWRASWVDPRWDVPEDFLPFIIGCLLMIGFCMGVIQFLTSDLSETTHLPLFVSRFFMLLIFVPTTLYFTCRELGRIERHELEGMNQQEVWTRALWLVAQPPVAWARVIFEIPWHLIW